MAQMTSEEVNATLNDPGFQQTVFENLWQMFVVPNVQARQERGELPNPIGLRCCSCHSIPRRKN